MNSDSGVYEYYAKEIECLQDFYNQEKRLIDDLKKTTGIKDSDFVRLKKLNIYKKRLAAICTSLAPYFCKVHPESKNTINNNFIFEKLKDIPYKDLGKGRKNLLNVMGYTWNGEKWKKDDQLRQKFIEAINYCHSNKFCFDNYSTLSDIPSEVLQFVDMAQKELYSPIEFLSNFAEKMFDSAQKQIERRTDFLDQKATQLNEKAVQEEKNKALKLADLQRKQQELAKKATSVDFKDGSKIKNKIEKQQYKINKAREKIISKSDKQIKSLTEQSKKTTETVEKRQQLAKNNKTKSAIKALNTQISRLQTKKNRQKYLAKKMFQTNYSRIKSAQLAKGIEGRINKLQSQKNNILQPKSAVPATPKQPPMNLNKIATPETIFSTTPTRASNA